MCRKRETFAVLAWTFPPSAAPASPFPPSSTLHSLPSEELPYQTDSCAHVFLMCHVKRQANKRPVLFEKLVNKSFFFRPLILTFYRNEKCEATVKWRDKKREWGTVAHVLCFLLLPRVYPQKNTTARTQTRVETFSLFVVDRLQSKLKAEVKKFPATSLIKWRYHFTLAVIMPPGPGGQRCNCNPKNG